MNDADKRQAQYETMSPWADADPVPVRGITPGLTGLEGRKIGLFANGKRAAVPMLAAVERQLKERIPSAETSWYRCSEFNTPEILTHGKEKFEAWVCGVDAVILSVGD